MLATEASCTPQLIEHAIFEIQLETQSDTFISTVAFASLPSHGTHGAHTFTAL